MCKLLKCIMSFDLGMHEAAVALLRPVIRYAVLRPLPMLYFCFACQASIARTKKDKDSMSTISDLGVRVVSEPNGLRIISSGISFCVQGIWSRGDPNEEYTDGLAVYRCTNKELASTWSIVRKLSHVWIHSSSYTEALLQERLNMFRNEKHLIMSAHVQLDDEQSSLLDAYLKSLCALKVRAISAAAAIEATSLVDDLYDSKASPCASIASASSASSELQCLTHPMHQEGNRGPMQDPLLVRHYASDSP